MTENVWREKIKLISELEQSDLLERIIQRFQPPLCRTAVNNCIDQASVDQIFGEIDRLQSEKLYSLVESLGLPTQMPPALAEPFPVYYRLAHSLRNRPKVRALLHTVLAHHESRPTQDYSKNREYHDLRSLEVVLVEAARAPDETAEELSMSELADLVEQNSDARLSDSDADKDGPTTEEQARSRALELLRDERTIGDRKRNPGVRGKLDGAKDGKAFDRKRAPSLLRKLGLDDEFGAAGEREEGGSSHGQGGSERLLHRRSTDGGEPADPPGPQVRIPFENPYSGRVSLQRQERVNLTKLQNDSVVSATDYHRLSPDVRAKAIAALHQAGDGPFAFGWLIATLGLPINRLAEMTAGADALPGDEPQYNPGTGVLSYRVKTGAVPVGNGENRVVALSLPAPLPRIINRLIRDKERKVPPGEESVKPLYAAQFAARRCLRRVLHDQPGPPVTLRALGSGALEMLMPLCCDEVEALLFTGNPGHYHAAAEAYRTSEVSKLNEIYADVCKKLAAEVVDIDPHAKRALKILRSPTEGVERDYSVGTGRHVSASQWRAFFTDLRRDWRKAKREVLFAPPRSRERVERLTSLYQFAAAYAYLGWSLGACARPTSRRSRICVSGDDMYVSDKSSKSFKERRVLPVAPTVRAQIAMAEDLLEEVLLTVEQSGGPQVRDRRGGNNSGLPPWVYVNRHGVHITDLTMRHLGAWSQERGYPLHQWASNVTRSSGIVMLRRFLPSVVLDAQTGHARGSRDASSTWSGLTRPALFDALQKGVEQLLRDVGFQKLKASAYG
jgi:hypothetical protein